MRPIMMIAAAIGCLLFCGNFAAALADDALGNALRALREAESKTGSDRTITEPDNRSATSPEETVPSRPVPPPGSTAPPELTLPPAISAPTRTPPKAPEPPKSHQAHNWQLYVNKRFGTKIDYPADFLTGGYSSINGDGTTLQSNDGRIELKVFASFNALGHTLAQHESWIWRSSQGRRVTYEKRGRNWFVLSGFEGDSIFYEKRMMSDDGDIIHGFLLVYPATNKETMDPIVARLSRSFSIPREKAEKPNKGPTNHVPGELLSKGWWIVLGSFPTEPWQRQARDYEHMHARAARCGLKPFNDFSNKFRGFTPGYNLFVVGAYQSKSLAYENLEQARLCFPDAYLKRSEHFGE